MIKVFEGYRATTAALLGVLSSIFLDRYDLLFEPVVIVTGMAWFVEQIRIVSQE